MVCDIVVEMKEKKQGEGITVWGVAVTCRMAREGFTEKATFE